MYGEASFQALVITRLAPRGEEVLSYGKDSEWAREDRMKNKNLDTTKGGKFHNRAK